MDSSSLGAVFSRKYSSLSKRLMRLVVLGNCCLMRVDFPVARGPNRKKDFFFNRLGRFNKRCKGVRIGFACNFNKLCLFFSTATSDCQDNPQ